MKLEFYYIANGKLCFYSDGTQREIRSNVLESYLSKVKESAKRNEWKHSGEGAVFRNAYIPGSDAESRVSSVSSKVICAHKHENSLIYSISIDGTTGIYSCADGSTDDGIVISSGDVSYGDFDIKDGRIALTSSFAGESHIGVMKLGTTDCRTYTEGHTWDSRPSWSLTEEDVIYFCSSGLPENNAASDETVQRPPDMTQMAVRMFTAAAEPPVRGPSAIMKLNISEGTLTDLITDEKFDCICPQCLPDGTVCYIRRPYGTVTNTSTLGCLGDIVMMPFRLIGALFGFLNVFTAKYSGKTLSNSVGTKDRDEKKLFIDGNLINAEAELRENRSRGEKNPGIIPHTWELRCLRPNGDDLLIKKGVSAYHVDTRSGDILFSNGSAVIRITPDGKEEKLITAENVTFIR